ncbi:hypothetical protein HOP50_02g12800 [Chloropicon primus]|nr:hypothetical protein HOP50_02g12800 [Chloropicon primus]
MLCLFLASARAQYNNDGDYGYGYEYDNTDAVDGYSGDYSGAPMDSYDAYYDAYYEDDGIITDALVNSTLTPTPTTTPADDSDDSDDSSTSSRMVQRAQEFFEQLQSIGLSLVDHLVTRVEESEAFSEEAEDLLRDAAQDFRNLVRDIARSFSDFDEEDVQAAMENTLTKDLGLTEEVLVESGVKVEDVIEDTRTETVDLIYEENDKQSVEKVLVIPGDPLSPKISLIGPSKWVQFHQDNFTDYVRFGTKAIREIDQMGNVVQSMQIGKLVKTKPISTIASDVNLGTPDEQKRALEVVLAYPIDVTTLGSCPAGQEAQAFAASQDTGTADPSFLMRIYMIGKNAVEINYLGDDVLLHPYTLKYTLEIENWPYCDEGNRLEVVMDYKFSEKAEDCVIEDISPDTVPQSDATAIDASYDTIMSEGMMDLEQEMDDLMDDLDLDEEDWALEDDEEDWDDENWEEDWEEFEEDWEDDEEDKDNDRRKLLQGWSGRGWAKSSSKSDQFGKLYGMSSNLPEGAIQDLIKDLPPEEKVKLMDAVSKLQDQGRSADLDRDEVKAVKSVLANARRRLVWRTRKRVYDELRAMRRERFTVAATMRLLRKRLSRMQRTFSEGTVAEGFGHATMFMPSAALINGGKQKVEIEITEDGQKSMEMTVTFPNCGTKCIWDPTIEMNEDALLVSTPPNLNAASAAATGFTVVGSLLLGALVAALITIF